MTLPHMCALCFEDYGDGVWALVGPYEAVRVNVCGPCRTWEIRQLILLRASYEEATHFGNGE